MAKSDMNVKEWWQGKACQSVENGMNAQDL
jgi:hypothetical protein